MRKVGTYVLNLLVRTRLHGRFRPMSRTNAIDPINEVTLYLVHVCSVQEWLACKSGSAGRPTLLSRMAHGRKPPSKRVIHPELVVLVSH